MGHRFWILSTSGLLLLPILLAFSHKFYLSTTTIEHNPSTQSLEITVQTFTHDLEKAVEAGETHKLHLGSLKEWISANEKVTEYLRKHLKILVNGKAANFEYIGKEVEVHDCYVYLEIKGVKQVNALSVENTLLIGTFPKQVNNVNLKAGGKVSQLALSARKTSGSFDL
ncbi:MAG: DUF6702 family protein [Salibacteraceae bacterium]